MAKFLSIESTGNICSVCLSDDNKIIDEKTHKGNNIHDQILAESVLKIIRENDISNNKSLDAVAVSAGPGSFTGIRIGASIAKGLCYGNEPKFIAVPTLKAIAMACIEINTNIEYDNIIPVLYSVNNTAFISKYSKNLVELISAEIINIEKLKDKIENNDMICGNAGEIQKLTGQDKFINIELSSLHIANLGLSMYQQEIFTNPEDFKPIYAQDFVPKIKLKNIKY